ncbi:protein phosphatase 1 regulatory subunit 27 [Gymnodraco acuticeps]|uniref:Protein phosphatase 1 regulatory subunit 27 n=1 Tax=Gymnodraco acuticeps TaxID=8218 RepID=A0A6P8TDZ2_GYMAC|nr:protein phosphatase 1 regulatory subunit 27 [Gymnodraco acuticeps]
MKYNYHVPSYTRTSQYTPSYTPTYHTPHITHQLHPTTHQAYTSTAKYTPTQYSSTNTPHHYTRPLTSRQRRTPLRQQRGTVQFNTAHTSTGKTCDTVAPAKKTVHFPNDIIFQDIVRRGDMEQIGRFMRARKVRVDTIFHSGMAAIHEAVLTGSLEVVKLLVKYGADVHQRDEDGWTPLHMACSDGYPEIARYLLSTGASTVAENENGEKPADLIDPDCKELVKLFETGCV